MLVGSFSARNTNPSILRYSPQRSCRSLGLSVGAKVGTVRSIVTAARDRRAGGDVNDTCANTCTSTQTTREGPTSVRESCRRELPLNERQPLDPGRTRATHAGIVVIRCHAPTSRPVGKRSQCPAFPTSCFSRSNKLFSSGCSEAEDASGSFKDAPEQRQDAVYRCDLWCLVGHGSLVRSPTLYAAAAAAPAYVCRPSRWLFFHESLLVLLFVHVWPLKSMWLLAPKLEAGTLPEEASDGKPAGNNEELREEGMLTDCVNSVRFGR